MFVFVLDSQSQHHKGIEELKGCFMHHQEAKKGGCKPNNFKSLLQVTFKNLILQFLKHMSESHCLLLSKSYRIKPHKPKPRSNYVCSFTQVSSPYEVNVPSHLSKIMQQHVYGLGP